jgi:hypothetical protein
VPQVLPGGNMAYTAYSGVFRTDFDLPFTNAITTRIGESYEEQGFNQYLNHYHCAVVPVFLNDNDAMHNVFFGGMAQYIPDTNGTLAQDNSIPFVSTIADVTRNGAGVLSETALEISMNGLKGAGAEFIPNPNLTRTLHGVIVLSSLPKDSLLLGWIVGGIEADLPSIFWINDGSQSRAENRIMEVWLQGNMPATVIPISNEVELRAFPCPMNDHVFVTMQLNRESDVELLIRNTAGKKVYRKYLKNEPAGEFKHTIKIDNALNAGIYILEIATYDGIHKMKLIVSE